MTATTTISKVQTTAARREQFTTDSVTTQDGTSISYRKLGRGPGVVILHGAMESAHSHMQLAQGLAEAFTVYLPERRGHNLPVPFRKDYGMPKEVEDLEALLTKTGTQAVFGVSAGGIIGLQAALTLPTIHKVALYEPALIVNSSVSTEFLRRYDREMAEGKISAALITAMKGGQLGPAFLNYMPRWLLEMITSRSIADEDKHAQPGEITMRMLAPTLHYDFQLVAEMAGTLENFKKVPAEVLLLGGSESPTWLKVALDTLEKVLPHVQRIEFRGLDHGGSSDPSHTNRNSQPEPIADELRKFFG